MSMSMSLCVAVGALAVAELSVPDGVFTLSWTHSVERTQWQERYRLADGVLILEEARVVGSGAGMEPPPDALWQNGGWTYRPDLPPLEGLVLANSGFGGRYRLCTLDECRFLSGEASDGRTSIDIRPCGGMEAP